MCIINPDPEVGYYSKNLILPKKYINSQSIKAGLEFPVIGNEGLEYLQLWEETKYHLIIPRDFISKATVITFPFPILSMLPSSLLIVPFISRIILDLQKPSDYRQRDAAKSMINSKGGILNLRCGGGKTVIALYLMYIRKVPALVIVNNTTLINQWRERIDQFLDVPGGIGIIQGPVNKWDWEGRGICIAMVHTLSRRHKELPTGIDEYFGLEIYDECHHFSAKHFLPTASLFYGERHGLTATTKREDGLEAMYLYHLGPIYHRDLMQDLKPEIYFQQCPIQINLTNSSIKRAVTDKSGRPSIPKLRNYISCLPECLNFIAEKLKNPINKNRKILVLSHSVNQLQMLNKMFSNSGLCIGKKSPEDRLNALKTKQITFGTLQLVKEALDEDSLDTLFFLTPFGSQDIEEGGFNTLQQGMGRAQRFREGKKTPIVVFIDYMFIPKLHRMITTLKRQLINWPIDQGGPLSYTTIQPYKERL